MSPRPVPSRPTVAVRKALRSDLLVEVGEILDQIGSEGTRHPVESLLEAGERASSIARLVEELVRLLSPRYEPDTERGRALAALWGIDHLGDGAPHVLLSLLGEWTDRQARIAKVALDAGIDERQQRLSEEIAGRLQTAVRATMVEIGLTSGLADRAELVLAGHLRALGNGREAERA